MKIKGLIFMLTLALFGQGFLGAWYVCQGSCEDIYHPLIKWMFLGSSVLSCITLIMIFSELKKYKTIDDIHKVFYRNGVVYEDESYEIKVDGQGFTMETKHR